MTDYKYCYRCGRYHRYDIYHNEMEKSKGDEKKHSKKHCNCNNDCYDDDEK